MKRYEYVLLFLMFATAFLKIWWVDLSQALFLGCSILYLIWTGYDYFVARKSDKIILRLGNFYYRSLFTVGLIFTLYNYPGNDAVAIAMMGFSILYILLVSLNNISKNREALTAYIYLQVFILCYLFI